MRGDRDGLPWKKRGKRSEQYYRNVQSVEAEREASGGRRREEGASPPLSAVASIGFSQLRNANQGEPWIRERKLETRVYREGEEAFHSLLLPCNFSQATQ